MPSTTNNNISDLISFMPHLEVMGEPVIEGVTERCYTALPQCDFNTWKRSYISPEQAAKDSTSTQYQKGMFNSWPLLNVGRYNIVQGSEWLTSDKKTKAAFLSGLRGHHGIKIYKNLDDYNKDLADITLGEIGLEDKDYKPGGINKYGNFSLTGLETAWIAKGYSPGEMKFGEPIVSNTVGQATDPNGGAASYTYNNSSNNSVGKAESDLTYETTDQVRSTTTIGHQNTLGSSTTSTSSLSLGSEVSVGEEYTNSLEKSNTAKIEAKETENEGIAKEEEDESDSNTTKQTTSKTATYNRTMSRNLTVGTSATDNQTATDSDTKQKAQFITKEQLNTAKVQFDVGPGEIKVETLRTYTSDITIPFTLPYQFQSKFLPSRTTSAGENNLEFRHPLSGSAGIAVDMIKMLSTSQNRIDYGFPNPDLVEIDETNGIVSFLVSGTIHSKSTSPSVDLIIQNVANKDTHVPASNPADNSSSGDSSSTSDGGSDQSSDTNSSGTSQDSSDTNSSGTTQNPSDAANEDSSSTTNTSEGSSDQKSTTDKVKDSIGKLFRRSERPSTGNKNIFNQVEKHSPLSASKELIDGEKVNVGVFHPLKHTKHEKAKNVHLIGTNSHDTIKMGHEGQIVHTHRGDDIVVGTNHSDIIFSKGNDNIQTRGGNDHIKNFRGSLFANTGNGDDLVHTNVEQPDTDTISLGKGADKLIIFSKNKPLGKIVVNDLEAKDIIRFRGNGFKNKLSLEVNGHVANLFTNQKLIASFHGPANLLELIDSDSSPFSSQIPHNI